MQGRKIVYIGVTTSLAQRMKGHLHKDHNCARVYVFKSKVKALSYERRWIRMFKPVYNKQKVHDPNYERMVPIAVLMKPHQRDAIREMARKDQRSVSDFIKRNLKIDLKKLR